jgi:hypothetical protein
VGRRSYSQRAVITRPTITQTPPMNSTCMRRMSPITPDRDLGEDRANRMFARMADLSN